MLGNRSMVRYLQWLTRRPVYVVAGCLAVTACLALGALRVEVYVDIDANLPAHHPYVEADRDIHDAFGGRNMMAVALRTRRGSLWAPEPLGILIALTNDVIALPGVVEANVLSLAASKVKDVRGTADGLEARPILAGPPADAAVVAAIREAYERNRHVLGPLVGESGRTAAVFFEFDDAVADEEAHEQATALVSRYETLYPEADFFLTGRPVFAWEFTRSARRTVQHFAVALAVIMAALWLSFRSLQGTLIPIGTGLLSTLWGLGVMGWAGAHMDGWNSMTPILILAVAAGHSVQILKRYYEEYERAAGAVPDARERNRYAVIESVRHTGPVMIVAGTVAAGGFASLVVFGIPSIRSFGVFTALGILSAVVLEMTFVPAARALMPPPRERAPGSAPSASDRLLEAMGRWCATTAGRLTIYAATLVTIVASALFATRIEVNNSVRDYLTDDSEARLGSLVMERDLGGIIPCLVLLEGEGENTLQDPAVLSWMDRLAEELRRVPSVTVVTSLADVVRHLHRALHEDDPAFDRIPDNRRLVAQLLLLYSMSAEPEDFSRFTSIDYARGLLRATLRSDQSADVLLAVRAIEDFASRHPLPRGVSMRIGGMGPISLALDQTLTEGKILNIALVLLMVYGLSSLVLGSPLAGVFVILPLVVAVAANFGALGAFGLWLNMGTATIAAMSVGIGADYAIYLTYRLREEIARTGDERRAVIATLRSSGKAVFFVALAISVGYGSLAFSDFYLNQVLSRLVPLTMAVSCLVALTLLPAAFLHGRPGFLFVRDRLPAGRKPAVPLAPAAHPRPAR